MEKGDGLDVPDNRGNGQKARTQPPGFLLYSLQEHPTDALSPPPGGHHDRLDLRFCLAHNQPDQADHLPGAFRNPDALCAYLSEMPVKVQARIVAADGKVLVNLAMTLYQFDP
jgi:hypothetical protein